MADRLNQISSHREAILLGELGALLHMFGKCSRDFLLANAIDRDPTGTYRDYRNWTCSP